MRGNILVLVMMGMAVFAAPGAVGASGNLATYRDSLTVPVANPTQCDGNANCGNLGGVSVDNYAIASALAGTPSGATARYRLYDTGGLSGAATDLRVCFFDAAGNRLRCDGNTNDISAGVPTGSATARVILVTGADRPYELKLSWLS